MPTITSYTIIAPTEQDIRQAAEAVGQLNGGTLDMGSVPEIAVHLFRDVLSEIALGNMVSVQRVERHLTTTEAAEFLNVSRPYIIKLLNEGKLPFHLVGSHRRVRYEELVAYKKKQDERSYQLMAELQAEGQELNMGY